MSDWTKELFEKHGELFLSVLEERIAQASEEVDVLLKYLKEQGFDPKNILDLNCGIGRHSIELGKRGIRVLGTDISPLYIKIAKKRAKEEKVKNRVLFKIADMREIASVLSKEKPFDGIIVLFTSFGYYDDETNDDILRQCLRLVRSEGFFVLEILNKEWLIENFQERSFSQHKNIIILDERQFDPETSRIRNIWRYLVQRDEKNFVLEKQIIADHRLWNLHELKEMFERTGWQFQAAYPGFYQHPKGIPLVKAKRLLVIAKK